MRINQFLARSGVASRRKSEEIILSGSVFLNGQPVNDLATEVNPATDKVEVNGAVVKIPEQKYFLLNKPAGYVTTKSDPHAKRTIFDLMPNDNSLIAVGRLDKDTTGLIIITNDGQFAQNIIHPSQKIEKEYFVITKTKMTNDQCQKLLQGVELEDGAAKATKVRQISDTEIMITVEEGRNRLVRRMITAIGNEVLELRRDRIGQIKLDVPVGQYRELTDGEVAQYA